MMHLIIVSSILILVNLTVVNSSPSQSASFMTPPFASMDFERSPSPRAVKTKSGLLKGILLTPPKLATLKPSSPTDSSSNEQTSSTFHQQIKVGKVEAFLGVPYATPPIEQLRFMPPVTPSHWRGVRMANSFGSSCPQRIPSLTINGQKVPTGREHFLNQMKTVVQSYSEDCLYLNVYIPFHDQYDSDRSESNNNTKSNERK